MERVKKGEKYWCIIVTFNNVEVRRCVEIDEDEILAVNNYFHTQEEAETMAKKLRAVLKGADVIEMPSEEDASFESAYLLDLSGHEGDDRTEEAYLDGFADCLHWLKSKLR